jgi:hypothetical protein
MLEELINQQWQALAKLFRGGKRLGRMAIGAVSEQKDSPEKTSVSHSVGRHPQADALEAYRRRFASPPQQGYGLPSLPKPVPGPPPPGQGYSEPPVPPFKSASQPELGAQQPFRGAYSERPQRHQAHGRKTPANDWGARADNSLDAAWGALASGLGRIKGVIVTVIICAVFFGGAYGYRTLKGGRAEIANAPRALQPAPEAAQTAQPPRNVEQRPQKPIHAASNKKIYYDRLTPEAEGTTTPAAMVEMTAVNGGAPAIESLGPAKNTLPGAGQAQASVQLPPVVGSSLAANAQQPAKSTADAQVSASDPVIAVKPGVQPQVPAQIASAELAAKDQAPLRERTAGASAPLPQFAPTLQAAHALAADKPMVVHSERYLPDGTRTDASALAAGALAATGLGEARAPVLASSAPPVAVAPQTTVETPVAALTAPVVNAPAVPEPAAPVLLSGYFAQMKSDQNRKAAEAELALIAEKYGAVLGQIPLTTREANLKDRGIWFRVLAGPVKSHDDADNLCKRLKGAGVQACIVQKFD